MTRLCKAHGDTLAACREQHSRNLWCDGQGEKPKFTTGTPDMKGRTWGECSACGVWFTLRADGTLRAHNGRGK